MNAQDIRDLGDNEPIVLPAGYKLAVLEPSAEDLAFTTYSLARVGLLAAAEEERRHGIDRPPLPSEEKP